jgi:Carboxypeptidase regulatory-like domain
VKVRSLLLVSFAAFVFGAIVPSPQGGLVAVASAQNLGERKVSGAVTDSESAPVTGATVFLRSLKTKSIRSFTSVENGHYHFAQVNKAEDYDLWAEKDGKKSGVKTVSSWDARTEFVADLKIK